MDNPSESENEFRPEQPQQPQQPYGQQPPYGQQQPYGQSPYGQPSYPQQPLFPESKQMLPNATAVLVLGILSIVLCLYLGVVLGVIGLVLASKGRALYKENPSFYDGYGQLNAGWIMSIIGTCLSGLIWLVIILNFIFLGSMASFSRWH